MKYFHKLLLFQKSLPVVLMLIVATAYLTGCSQGNEGAEEKGRRETTTDKTTKAIVKQIKTPLSKAQDTQNLGDERLQEMDKALKQ